MPTVSQLPAQLDAECVAGDPFVISITSSGATITAPAVSIRDGLGAASGVTPTVTQVGAVTTISLSGAQTAALNSGTFAAEWLWSLSATVNGSGPFQLVARTLRVYPVGTAGVSTSAAATLAVTVGGAAVSLTVALGGGGGGSGDMLRANNLSDLTNAATARTNLGLGSAATQAASAFAPATMVASPINVATSGVYCSFPVSAGAQTTVAHSNGLLAFTPLMLAIGRTADRIGIEVTGGGTASVSVHRLGIWADNGGVPGTLLVDAGTVATDSTGLKEITISQALAAQTLYWLGAVQQGAPATAATIRCCSTFGPHMTTANPSATPNGPASGGVTGALASSPTLNATSNQQGQPRIFLRFT